jgi:hypothetical protein
MIGMVILSILSILLVLVDAFEAMILPRRVGRKFRLTMLLYRTLWPTWRAMARTIKSNKQRHTFLSVFGPFSLLLLFALWAIVLIFGFGLLNWSLGTKLQTPYGTAVNLFSYFYLSGVTFFTLGFGDFTPLNPLGRVVTVAESGIGFGFLAVVIGYMPVLYQAFSKREVSISLLDARAGSPPTAAEILMRFAKSGAMDRLDGFLNEWERWSAELLESTISFPVLAYYRSQHDNQSWLGALTAILDTCAVAMSSEKGANTYQARVTFAMARHAVVDICLILMAPPITGTDDRLGNGTCELLMEALGKAGVDIKPETGMQKLKKLRDLYEPFLNGLAKRLVVTLPPIAHPGTMSDNWQSSAWTRRAAPLDRLGQRVSDHFD